MIVLHEHRLVYIHPPKTAGTSVSLYLSALTTYRDLELGGTTMGEAVQPEFYRRFGLSKHSTYAEVIATDPALAEYRSVGTWRHPLSRVRSMFGFLRAHDAEVEPAWRSTLRACADVNAFVGSGLFATDGPDRMFRPVAMWLEGVGKVLDVATLSVALPAWLESIGVPAPSGLLPRANAAAAPDDTPYRPDVERALRERYAADLAMAPWLA